MGRTSHWTKADECWRNGTGSSWACELYFDKIHDIYWARVRAVAGGELSQWAYSSELQPYRDSKDQGAPSAGLLPFPGWGGQWGEGSLGRSGGLWWEIT